MTHIQILKPFQYQSFRRLLLAELIYRSPIWMLCMVFGLMMKTIHPHSSFYLGLIGFLYNIPLLLISPIGGILADRFKRLHIMIILQLWYIIPCIIIIIAMHYHFFNTNILLLSTMLTGIGFAIGFPTIQAIVADTIPDTRILGSGVSVYSAGNRIFQFMGYSLGGFAFAFYGATTCFVIAIICHIVALLILCTIQIKQKGSNNKRHPLIELKEGWQYARKSFPISHIMVCTAVMGFFVWPYIFQMPLINANYFHGNPKTLGILLAVGGIGGGIGGLIITLRKSSVYVTKFLRISIIGVALSLLALSMNTHVMTALPWMFTLDLSLSLFAVCSATLLHHICEDNLRGRVMSFFGMANFGMIPCGSLIYYGYLGKYLNPLHLFQITSAILIITFIVFCIYLNTFRKAVLPIYLQKSLLENDSNINQI